MDCIKTIKIQNPKDAEDYFDCTMSETEYVKMLKTIMIYRNFVIIRLKKLMLWVLYLISGLI